MKLLLVLALAACGGPALRTDFPPPEPTETAPPKPRPPARPILSRAALDSTLDAGPGAFLGSVKLRAVTTGGRFVGWEILELDPRYRGAGLAPGDVVSRVNGHSIERPDDLVALWQALRGANELDFDVRRAGTSEVVRVPVEE